MKISSLFVFAALMTANVLPAASGDAACCADEKSVGAPCCAALSPSLPLTARSLYQLESMWTNDAGAAVRLASLRGRPVVLAMFFAQCEYACPMIVADMQRLRDLLPSEARAKAQFVLVSFDSARDTPAALASYREKLSLDRGWTLLRGEANFVQELAMLLGVSYKQDARGQFSHSNLITVLNSEGEIAYQKNGLMGDMSEAAKAVTVAADHFSHE